MDNNDKEVKDKMFHHFCHRILGQWLSKKEASLTCNDLKNQIHHHKIHDHCYNSCRGCVSESSIWFEDCYNKCCKDNGCECKDPYKNLGLWE